MPRAHAVLTRHGLLSPAAQRRLVDVALAAHRAGALPALCREHGPMLRGLLRRLAPPLFWWGRPQAPAALARCLTVLFAWGTAQARPDGVSAGGAEFPRHAWLGASAWRPLVALAAHYGLAAVPAFPDRYRARPDEPAFEHLCGLWDVAPSSFYRYVERGRDDLVRALQRPLTGDRFIELCAVIQQDMGALTGDMPAGAAALWQALANQNAGAAVDAVERSIDALASDKAADALLQHAASGLTAQDGAQPLLVRLCLARAVIASARADHDAERHFLDEALRLASVWGDPVLLGTVHAGLGRLHEARDADKAFIHQRESGAFFETALRQQGLGDLLEAIDPGAVQTSRVPIADGQGSAFVSACGLAVALLRQAWLLVSRNDPRCRPLLMRSQQLLACIPNAPLDTLALAAQAHGELLRREGDVRGGLESTLAALALCERSGNRLQQLRIEGTLALIYGDQGDLDKAQAYAQRVFGHAASGRVDPEILASTHQNLGNAQFWAGRLDDAVRSYEEGLRFATASGLRTLIGRAHYNLAEACYTRFQAGGDAQDEARGDMHARLSGAVWSLAGDKAALEATSNLKRTVLGEREQLIYDRMLPGELAAHFDEMSEIQTERLHQSAARDAADRIRATLKIARAYSAIAAKEREAALALIRLQPGQGQWATELAEVRSAFEAALSDEEREVQRWRLAPGCPVPAALLPLVVRQSRSPEGLTKSNYAHRCGLSPSTASKHLAQLAALGLVTRHGLGPTTRYLAQKD